ncbi:MAG: nitrate transporter ATPase [Bacteriovoracaceae bacterium]|nr:nitrate transporter ATPase [Bacteriovoracaceae bacterium]
MSEIRIQGIEKIYSGGISALESLSLEIQSGEFLSIIGPSGCGKSTLLRLIAGLEMPSRGSIEVSSRERLSYVFQDSHLLPWRTAIRNVALPLELTRMSREVQLTKALEALDLVGLKEFANAYPNQLSGGMKMRVSLARALVTDPALLLLDEPFAALDEITRQKLDEDLRKLWQLKKMTVVFVTHSIQEATFLSNRALVLSQRPGRIILDRRLKLPEHRDLLTKTSQAYLDEMAALYRALESSKKEEIE